MIVGEVFKNGNKQKSAYDYTFIWRRLINDTKELFEKILHAAESVNTQINEASAISHQLSAGSSQVFTSVNQMTEVVKEAAMSSDAITRASEEQLRSMEKINEIADLLSGLVNELDSLTQALQDRQ